MIGLSLVITVVGFGMMYLGWQRPFSAEEMGFEAERFQAESVLLIFKGAAVAAAGCLLVVAAILS